MPAFYIKVMGPGRRLAHVMGQPYTNSLGGLLQAMGDGIYNYRQSKRCHSAGITVTVTVTIVGLLCFTVKPTHYLLKAEWQMIPSENIFLIRTS